MHNIRRILMMVLCHRIQLYLLVATHGHFLVRHSNMGLSSCLACDPRRSLTCGAPGPITPPQEDPGLLVLPRSFAQDPGSNLQSVFPMSRSSTKGKIHPFPRSRLAPCDSFAARRRCPHNTLASHRPREPSPSASRRRQPSP